MKSKIHELSRLFKKAVSKKLITTLAIGFSMLSAKANFSSALNLKLFDNGVFTVVLDEKPSCQPAGFFSDDCVKPGYHKLKVIRHVNSAYGYYPVKQVVYRGWIDIPAKSVVFATINCHNQFDIVKIEPKFCGPVGGCGHGCEPGMCPGHGNGHGNGHGYGHGNDHGNGHGNGGGQTGWNPAPPPPPMPVCMAPGSFAQLKASMASKSFDSSRLEIAQQAVSFNFFSAEQVADLMRMFSFETSRLEFAKMVYMKTIDKQNYFVVNNSFTFESSIGELNEFIASHG